MIKEFVALVTLHEDRVFVRAHPSGFDRGLHLASGQDTFSLTPVVMSSFFREAIVVPEQELESISIQPNLQEEWSVPGARNTQLHIRDRHTPASLLLGTSEVLQEGLENVTFSALLASHRANATLEVELAAADGSVLDRAVVTLNPHQKGGRERADYQRIQVSLPWVNGAAQISARLHYQGPETPDYPYDPFIFLTDPTCFGGAGSDVQRGETLFAGIDTPDMEWFEAQISPVRPNSSALELVMAEERQMLLAPRPSTIQLISDDRHSLCFRAEEITDVTLYINGEGYGAARIEQYDCWVRLPSAVLTGDPAKLELRDSRGLSILYETWIVPPRVLTPADVLQREGRPPFDSRIFAQSGRRFDALRAHLEHGSPAEVLAQLPQAVRALEEGYEHLTMRPLALPEVLDPKVSIVIPAHNKVEVTYACLCALLLAWNRATFEVILVDDASTDATATIETLVSGLKVVRNAEAQRFIRACNAGVAASRGEYVVLLNNDTEPTVGWLDELLETFTRFSKVGLAGSKLLYPDGRLQDAGGIIWGSGNPWNYGHRQNPEDPRFSYARQADYLSGAALMMPRSIWDEVGGLSAYLEPMYFEDTDLSFKVRDAGYTTWFVPSSVVYHYEGMTSGTSTASGFKRYQEVNRPKFKRRWARAFATHGREGELPDLEKDRGCIGRVLFIDYMLPRADRDAGSYAALQEIRLVQSLGFKVTFLPENLADMGDYTRELQRMGVEVITAPFYLSVNEFLDGRGAEFDAFYVTRYHVAENVVPVLRRVNPEARIVMNNADLHFLRVMRTALAKGNVDELAEVNALRERELAAMRSVDLVLSYNDVEHAVIQSHTNGAVKVAKCPWVVEPSLKTPPREGRSGLSFLGSFNHHPNEEGVMWFAAEVMPRLAAHGERAQLSIYGSGMKPKIKSLASDMIVPTGFVETVDLAYDPHMVFVAPLLSGAGIKGKVLSALAHGVPSVLSPVAAEGIGLRHGYDCLIASSPAEWERAIASLLEDEALWQRLSENARTLIETSFSFTKGREDMRRAFETLDIFGMLD